MGEIPVTTKLTLGAERLRLFLTSERIIVGRVGKRGAGEVATTSLLGRFGTAFEELFQGGRESFKTRKGKQQSPDELLRLDRDNFAINYGQIVSVTLGPERYGTSIMMLTADDKYDFSTPLGLDRVLGFLEPNLGSRLKVQRIRQK